MRILNNKLILINKINSRPYQTNSNINRNNNYSNNSKFVFKIFYFIDIFFFLFYFFYKKTKQFEYLNVMQKFVFRNKN